MPQIDRLFDALLGIKGSDLHLGVGYPPLARARGELVSLRDGVVTEEEMQSLLFEIINPQQQKQITEDLDLDFAYLRSLNAAAHFSGGWPEPQQIPTLREVLDLARGHVQVYIEIKPSRRDSTYGSYPHIAETVIEEVRTAAMLDQVLIISFDWTVLPLVKSIEPTLLTGALVSRDVWNPDRAQALAILIDQVTALGCNWINMDRNLFMPLMPAAAHRHGFKLGLWTVNARDQLRRLAATGVDSLTSDRPDLFTIFS